MNKNELKFMEKGKNITIYNPTTLLNPERVVLKNNILISEYCHLAGGLGLYIGNFIHISTQSSISGGGYCILEDFVGFSAGARVITGSEDISGKGLTNPTIPEEFRSVYRTFVHFKKHSFLATNAIVHPGVTVGEGSVIGSGSVVTKDVEPWSIYMGIPARKIKERPKEVILSMEKELLEKYSIKSSDFSAVIEKIRQDMSNR